MTWRTIPSVKISENNPRRLRRHGRRPDGGPADLLRIEALEEQHQRAGVDLTAVAWTGKVGWKLATFQTLMKNDKPSAIPPEDLHMIAASVERDEHVACERGKAEGRAGDPVQSIDVLSHIDRKGRDEDADRRRKAQHDSASTTARRDDGSKPGGTSTRRPEGKTTARWGAAGAKGADGARSSMNAGGSGRSRRAASRRGNSPSQ